MPHLPSPSPSRRPWTVEVRSGSCAFVNRAANVYAAFAEASIHSGRVRIVSPTGEVFDASGHRLGREPVPGMPGNGVGRRARRRARRAGSPTPRQQWGIYLRGTYAPVCVTPRTVRHRLMKMAAAARREAARRDGEAGASMACCARVLEEACLSSEPVYALRRAVAASQRHPIAALRPLRDHRALRAILVALEVSR